MSDIKQLKKGICPYCDSEISIQAHVCKNCGRDVYLIFDILSQVEKGYVGSLVDLEPEQKIDTRFNLAFIITTTVVSLYLLRFSAGSGLYQYQIFLWMISLMYSYISVKYYHIKNMWVLILFPAIVPFLLFVIINEFPSWGPEDFEILTEYLWTTIYLSAFFSLFYGIAHLFVIRKFKLQEFISVRYMADYLTKYTGRIESIQKIVLTVITFGSIIIGLFKIL
jgi:hypothetical protein